MRPRVHQMQLNLLGQLEAAEITVKFHLNSGVPSTSYWIEGRDDNGELVLMWSDATSAHDDGSLVLADVLADLLKIFRLTRDAGG